MKIRFLIISGLFILFTSLNGQKTDFSNAKYWLDIGAGTFSSAEDNSGVSLNLGASFVPAKTLYKIRYLHNFEFKFGGDVPNEHYTNFGLLGGRGFSGKFTQVYFSGGMGITYGLIRGRFLYRDPPDSWLWKSDHFEEVRFTTFSIPLEIHFVFKPIKYAGIGTTLFADINTKRANVGIILIIGLGKLR